MDKIGIFSGTFDPIHEGHILFAHVASEQFGLDKVLLIPEASPRHKPGAVSVDARIEMIALATQEAEHIEGYKSWEQTHTINGLMTEIIAAQPADEYYILMGADVFRGIGEWGSRSDEDGAIVDLADGVGFIVGVASEAEGNELEKLAADLKITARFILMPIANIASSKIRQAIQNGEQPRGLNDDVERYIRIKELYKK